MITRTRPFTDADVQLVAAALATAHCHCAIGSRCTPHDLEAETALETLAQMGRLTCLAEHRGMTCDRSFGHLGDHVDIYGPLKDHTWQ